MGEEVDSRDSRVGEPGAGLSAKQDAMNSWRSGFIRWRIRDGPIGSHQELARAEKCETSSAETDDVECVRLVVVPRGVREGRGEVCRYKDREVVGAVRRARSASEQGRRVAMILS